MFVDAGSTLVAVDSRIEEIRHQQLNLQRECTIKALKDQYTNITKELKDQMRKFLYQCGRSGYHNSY